MTLFTEVTDMCRIGSIKSKTPVPPSVALNLMLPQQEGHDNSGFAMVMQDLEGVFSHYKDKPLLSLACTPQGVQLVNDFMEEKGFVQVAQWVPEVDKKPGLKIEAMPRYVFRNYDYP
ncbi:MAG: glutamate synthase, partial [Desulfovibrio sp.]